MINTVETELLYDNYNRSVNSLRIQVNAICNFHCIFCHMEGTERSMEYMTPEQIERVVQVAASHGVNKIKFTGGEPLLREDIIEIVKRTRTHITGNISLTTNGVELPKLAKGLKEAGLDRVNISMHAIDEYNFHFITGTKKDFLPIVQYGIKAAQDAGLGPIKINFVLMKNINEDQVDGMIKFCAENNCIFQLIEFEANVEKEHSEEYIKYHVSLQPVEEKIKRQALCVEHNPLHNREIYTVNSEFGKVKIEFVKPMRNADFCRHCTRLRVTADGEFKTCLLRENDYFDIKKALQDQDELDNVYKTAVKARIPYWR
ncbi:GTP 3',8-cyclase MoaA [Ferroplasma sp.]|uniref:GTP 3',8-cyclase MoaA n=1 Tax=Ferroplasma sp. TaxID=2591003 RepID=UPI00307F0540